jgi:membrane fusion protein (multidrug efflux system)
LNQSPNPQAARYLMKDMLRRPSVQPANRGNFALRFASHFCPIQTRPAFFVLLLVLALSLAVSGCRKPPSTAVVAVPEVQVIALQATDAPVYEEWIGTLDGSVNAQIRAQVTGYLVSQNYAEGSRVKKGDVLFEIDARPFQAALEQAEARLAQDQAQLGKTELDVKRYTPLAKIQAMSQEELDNAVQANLAARAQLKADEAARDLAQVNLGFTKICSPIDGVAGLANAQIGDLLSSSSGVLTTVSTINPIRVYFPVLEGSYLNYWRRFTTASDGGQPEAPPELQLILVDGSVYPEPGKFFFADRQVNAMTGTLQITALFPNPDSLLRPGQYGRVRARTRTRRNVFVVPQRAVTELQGSYQVAVIASDNGTNRARLRTVKVGERTGSSWIIESGLTADDQLVVEGSLKIKEGTPVTVKPYVPGVLAGHPVAEAVAH